jgi:hypothetical protein
MNLRFIRIFCIFLIAGISPVSGKVVFPEEIGGLLYGWTAWTGVHGRIDIVVDRVSSIRVNQGVFLIFS